MAADAEDSLRHSVAKARSMVEVGRAITSSLNLQSVLDLIVDRACLLLGSPRSSLAVAEPGPAGAVIRFVAHRGLSVTFRDRMRPLHWKDGTTARAIVERRAVWSADILDDPAIELTPSTRAAVEAEGYRGVLSAPLVVGDRVLGALVVYRDAPGPFAEDDVEVLELFAAQAAVALENARLYREQESRAEKLRALSTLTRLIISAADPAVVCGEVARAATTLLDATFSRVWVTDPARQVLTAQGSFGVDAQIEAQLTTQSSMPYGTGVVTGVIATKQPEFIRDVQQDPRLVNRPLATELGIRSYAGVPMLAGERVVGVLTIVFAAERDFTDEEKELMQLLADQAAIAIDKARLYTDAERRRQEAEIVGDLAHEINATLDLDTVLQRVAEGARQLCAADFARIALRPPDGTAAVFRFFPGARSSWEGIAVEPGRGSGGGVLATGEPFRTDDYANDPRITKDYLKFAEREGTVAEMVVPIRGQERVEGLLYVTNRSTKPFTDRDEAVLKRLSEYARTAIDNARLYAALRDAKERGERSQLQLVQTERLRALGEMAAGVAHDFNNLLAVILGRSELLLGKTREPDLVRGLQAIRKAAQDGADTVRRIQEFTRTRTTRPFGEVDLTDVVREVVDLTRPRWENEAQSRGIDYDVRVEGTAASVTGRPEELREVFTNLLTNALESMPGGGTCVFTLSVEGDRSVVQVRDSGCGMSEVTRRRVFEPFFTTKGPRGTGLGLAVSWGIVTRHGGTIEVDSALGRGSTFRIALPVSVAVPAPEPTTTPVVKGRCARILVIDDEPEVRAVMADLLTEAGHEVTQATDGADGLRRCEATEFDLLLTDLSMPGLSGWDVAQAFRARFPTAPLGLVTGWGDQLDADRLVRHGVSFVIAKPFRADDVIREIAAVLGGGH